MEPLHLSARQRRALQRQLKKTPDVRVYRRTRAVLEYDRGRSVTEISRTLHVSRLSVYRWIQRYGKSSDPVALRDEERSGRPTAWTEECSQWLQSFLDRSPAELGYFAVNWTVPLLRDPLRICTGKRFSDPTIRRALKRLHYVWKRPRYTLAPDPAREKKTANSPQNPAIAASHGVVDRRRNRLVVVSSSAVQLESTRRAHPGVALRPERAARPLRRDQPSHGEAVVPGSTASATA